MGKNNEIEAKFHIGDNVILNRDSLNPDTYSEKDIEKVYTIVDLRLNGLKEYIYTINKTSGCKDYFEKFLRKV